MKLSEIVPWGRSLAEYQLMFSLTDVDLSRKILSCGDGPASFNTEMTDRGYSVVSIDPVYQFSAPEIRQRVQDTYEPIISQVKQNIDQYIWKNFANVDELGQARLASMEKFLVAFAADGAKQRYRNESLPSLGFEEQQFDLCLCSHLLFLYAEQLSLEFHLASIRELLRVAAEVRIFPLLQLNCEPCPYLEPVIQEFSEAGYNLQVLPVEYEFQLGGDRMLKISKHLPKQQLTT
jgi:hypothetical protein